MSLLVILVQLTTLYIVILESSYPRCNTHSDCSIGEYCAPAAGVLTDYRLDPGFCDDCYPTDWVFNSNRTQEEQVTYVTEIEPDPEWISFYTTGTPQYWDDAAFHCADTDTMPLRCDHLVDNRNKLSGGGCLVLIFSAILAIIPTIQDLDQASDEESLMTPSNVYANSDRFIRALIFLSNRARVFVIPMYVIGGSASLIISNEFTSQSFLLNAMAIGFASNVDDLLSFLLISETERTRVEEGTETILAEQGGGSWWKSNRLYGLLLSTTLVVIVLFCEQLMPFFSAFEQVGYEGNPCSDIADVIFGLPFRVVMGVIVLKAFFNKRNTTWLSIASDILLSVFCLCWCFYWVSVLGVYLHQDVVVK